MLPIYFIVNQGASPSSEKAWWRRERRRRQLYDERKWAAQSELRRVLAESAAVREKEGMLRLLLQVYFLVVFALFCFRNSACYSGMYSYTYRRENVVSAAACLLGG